MTAAAGAAPGGLRAGLHGRRRSPARSFCRIGLSAHRMRAGPTVRLDASGGGNVGHGATMTGPHRGATSEGVCGPDCH